MLVHSESKVIWFFVGMGGKWQIGEPRVSPDGKSVAFIEGLMSDEGLTGGDVMLAPTKGGTARNLTPVVNASPSSLSWNSAERISVVANVDAIPATWCCVPRDSSPVLAGRLGRVGN